MRLRLLLLAIYFSAELPKSKSIICPEGWHYNRQGDHCLALIRHRDSWKNQRIACRTLLPETVASIVDLSDIDLVTILNRRTNQFINDSLASWDGQFWIGLSDLSKESVFHWMNHGQQLSNSTYTSWKWGQPNDGPAGKEDCVMFSSGFWSDKKCSLEFKAICEIAGADKCKLNKGGCEHFCTNKVLSRVCLCKPNYVLQRETICVASNPCKTNNGGCSHNCTNIKPGKRKCKCRDGFELHEKTECVEFKANTSAIVWTMMGFVLLLFVGASVLFYVCSRTSGDDQEEEEETDVAERRKRGASDPMTIEEEYDDDITTDAGDSSDSQMEGTDSDNTNY